MKFSTQCFLISLGFQTMGIIFVIMYYKVWEPWMGIIPLITTMAAFVNGFIGIMYLGVYKRNNKYNKKEVQ